MKCSLMAVAGSMLVAMGGAAAAQQAVSRTSDYAVSFTSPTFSDASAHYGLSFAYGAQAATSEVFGLQLAANAQNLSYNSGGGISVNLPPSGPPYPTTTPVTITDTGDAGYWGATYDTAASYGGTTALTLGSQGGLATLNFDGGGSVMGAGYSGIGYFIYVHLPGDYTTMGTATGDYEYNGVGPGFSTPTFTYDPGTDETTVFTSNPNYSGTPTGLDFTLFGSAVPEPSTWVVMLVGFGAIGLLARRRRGIALTA